MQPGKKEGFVFHIADHGADDDQIKSGVRQALGKVIVNIERDGAGSVFVQGHDLGAGFLQER